MCAQWASGFNTNAIVEQLQKAKSGSKYQDVETASVIMDFIPVLTTAVDFLPGITESERASIARRVISAVVKSEITTAGQLIKEMSRYESQMLAQPMKPYVLVTTWSASLSNPCRRSVNRCSITVGAQLSKEFHGARRDEIENHPFLKLPDPPRGSAIVRVRTIARNPDSAFEQTMDAQDLIRGIWNFERNQRIYMSERNVRRPFNAITVGPSHTIHDPNGEVGGWGFWYEPDYVPHVSCTPVPGNSKHFFRFEAVIRWLIRESRYGEWLKTALLRYVRALDLADPDASFLKIWSVLEYLTCSQRHEKAVSRAVFLWRDAIGSKLILEHLRQRRNHAIHAGQSSPHAGTHLIQVKRYAERLLEYHLRRGVDFEDQNAAAAALDLPTDLQELARLQDNLTFSLKLRGGSVKSGRKPTGVTK